MSRPLRIEFPGAVYHVTARGNARQDIFLDDEDRRRFLDFLGREVEQQAWRCFAYCLMGNHYHLLFETPEPNLVIGMRRLNGRTAQRFNRRHGRVGHLLQGRYQAIVVDRESHLLELCRYLVLNPVRAGLTGAAEDWPWSSYRATAGLASPPDWLDIDATLGFFGRARPAARRAYRGFVAEGLGAASPWEDLRGGLWLGGAAFRERMEARLTAIAATFVAGEIPAAQRQPTRPSAAEVMEAVASAYGIAEAGLRRRRDPAAFRTAAYLLRRAANLRLKEVAEIFAVSPPWVSRIQAEIDRAEIDGGVSDRRTRALMRRFKLRAGGHPGRG